MNVEPLRWPQKAIATNSTGPSRDSQRTDDTTRTSGFNARSCRLCGAELTGRRRNGFCSDRCRMRATRQSQDKGADKKHLSLLTVVEVAELLRMSPKAVYAMKDRGQLPGVIRIGRRLRFDRNVLVDWLHQKHTPWLGE